MGCLAVFAGNAQELTGKVTLVTNRISTQVDKRIFNTLQNQLTNLINNRKWTEDNFKPNERIEVNFVLNLDRQVEANVYGASLIVQAARPIFNTSYNSPLVNWQDNDVVFRYVEFQPVEYNENRISGSDGLTTNLTAIIAYYINIILGFDYESFAANGGEPYFKKALFIVNNAPAGRNIRGWTQFDGLRNRYWLAENLLNNRYALMREAVTSYYRKSMDQLYEEEGKARAEMLNVLNLMNTFNSNNPNTMFLQFFMQSKWQELVELFKKASPDQRNRAVELLEKVDITNAKKYREALK
ncbi:MAG TPA: DUF4835 family protein [Phnomibacter sp.]|nr:DUF4835 family protein [Phnomibacter sp.]